MNEVFIRGILKKIIEDKVQNVEKEERKIGVYYPSELPFCIRRNYYLYTLKKELDIKTLLLFESGNMFHKWFNELFENSKYVELHVNEHECFLRSGDITIKGRVDDYLYFKIKNMLQETPTFHPEKERNEEHEGKESKEETTEEEHQRKDSMKYDALSIVEVKSVRNISPLNFPRLHHVMQLNFYLNRFNIDTGFIIYVDRRDLSFKIFEVNYDKSMFEEIVRRAKELHRYLLSGILPEAEASRDKSMEWQCSICGFRQECIRSARASSGIRDK